MRYNNSIPNVLNFTSYIKSIEFRLSDIGVSVLSSITLKGVLRSRLIKNFLCFVLERQETVVFSRFNLFSHCLVIQSCQDERIFLTFKYYRLGLFLVTYGSKYEMYDVTLTRLVLHGETKLQRVKHLQSKHMCYLMLKKN